MIRKLLILLALTVVSRTVVAQTTIFGGNPPTHNPGWTVLQDTSVTCVAGNSSCQFNIATGIFPTTAGSVWAVNFYSGGTTALTIDHTCSGNGACTVSNDNWTKCPALTPCSVFFSGHGSSDIMYNVSGTTGTTNVQVFLSGASATLFYLRFVEFLPPAGYTGSFDVSGSVSTSSCSNTVVCNGVGSSNNAGFILTGTDAVVQMVASSQSLHDFFAWGADTSGQTTYITDFATDGIALNMKTAPASPTFLMTTSGWSLVSAIAFKSTAGLFSAPAPVFKVANFTTTTTTVNCNPGCSELTVPAVTSGNAVAIFGANANGSLISTAKLCTVSGCGSGTVSNFTAPSTGTSHCQLSDGTNAVQCAYLLSAPTGSPTFIDVTLTGNSANETISIYEINRNDSGTFTAAGQGSATHTAPSGTFAGIALTPGTTNSCLFQGNAQNGGAGAPNLYPLGYSTNAYYFSNTVYAGVVALCNSTNGTQPSWFSNGANNSVVMGLLIQ